MPSTLPTPSVPAPAHAEVRPSKGSAGKAEGPRRLPLAEPLRIGPKPGGERASAEKLLQVGDLAKATGKTVRAIHHYEELGLLQPDARSKGRFRLYDPSAVTRVRWIGKLHDLGLSLGQIQHVIASWEHAPSAGRAMADVRAMYVERLADTRAQIERLRVLERELDASITYLDTCETCDLDELVAHGPQPAREGDALTTCTSCQHRDLADEPELVAGIHAGTT